MFVSLHFCKPFDDFVEIFTACKVTDVQGKDVVGKMETLDETDNKLILAPHFNCWDEGVRVGEVSPQTIAQLPKSS